MIVKDTAERIFALLSIPAVSAGGTVRASGEWESYLLNGDGPERAVEELLERWGGDVAASCGCFSEAGNVIEFKVSHE